ncbi:Uncharacterised protein [Brevibacterium casei]|uniref:Uncharacterized protein n=1 Tax=Brevibacterium casei TaxID=33889 RepID=A0A449CZU5_9MICO|nr:hypothetical protein [Brevibacterium casei]VEW10776.1 Uncharacterised protein [Brevibacterium casei]
MTKQRLFPYARLSSSDLDWGKWALRLNRSQTSESTVSDDWDSNAELSIGISVLVRSSALSSLAVRNPKLVLTVSCPSTAYSASIDAQLQLGQSSMTAEAELQVDGKVVSQVLTVRTQVIGEDKAHPWLRRRIIAEGPILRLPLDTELDGFPTSSYSFDREGMPAAPWRLVVTADELEAPFAHSIRLELNEDFAPVRKLIGGNPEAHVIRELDATIVRVLIATAARLSSTIADRRTLEEVAGEYPESIVAAAQRASEQYLQMSLPAAIKSYRLTPEKHDYEVVAGTNLLKD